jgi:hypothetical protein
MLRFLAILAIAAATAWGAYWFVGARALDRTVTRLLADHPAVAVQTHSIQGFPNRFDLTLTQPQLHAGTLRWQAPFVQILALSYRPHHVIVVFPHDQQASVAGREMALHSRNARASLVATPGLTLPLERSVLVVEGPQLDIDGATHLADAVRVASRALDPRLHEAVIEIETVIPDPTLMERLDPESHWPRRFEVLRLEGRVQFDRPLDRAALAGTLPRPTAVLLTGARMRFDDIDLVAEGVVEPDDAGRLNGPVTLTVTGWPALLQRLAEAGMIDSDQAGFLRPMLAGMADPQSPERIELALTLRDGALAVGPVTLARLPPLF